MLIGESIEKTKNFLQKSLLNFKSFFFGRYQKLSKATLLDSFSCNIGKTTNHQKDQYCTDHRNSRESGEEEAKKRRKNRVITSEKEVSEENASSGSLMKYADRSPVKNKQGETKKEEKKVETFRMDKRENQYSQKMNPESYALAQKVKQLNMMDTGDVEHVLDIEEAFHYYSRLKSPVYLDIVDKFFTDMYSEFSVPQPSVSINSSKRRIGSIRL